MERKACIARSYLEQVLVDEATEPKNLPLSLLEDITSDFSHDQEIGSGGFAVVYKGILGDKEIAVKKLSNFLMTDTEFDREVECLMRAKHKNVVRFLGYCDDTQRSRETFDGKPVMAETRQRLLCFEYIPNGSLYEYIKDPYRQWGTCYEIIKGICVGLQYLHESFIVHMDLKPANILLDNNMVPKIADFGLSRYFDENQSRDITKNMFGTVGYWAPEFSGGGVITRSADLYSLGVIILEILTGHKGHERIEDVLESWSDRLDRSQRDTLCEQIQECYEIAVQCREFNPEKRPARARDIINRLHETESMQIAEAASSTLGEKSNNNDPRLFRFVVPGPVRDALPLAGQTVVMPRPAGHATAAEIKPPLPSMAGEAFQKAWPLEAHSLSEDGLTNGTLYKVYYSPKLVYVKVVVLSARDLVPTEEGRSLVPTISAKLQMGSQIRRTQPGQPQGSANQTWNEEFLFVASEPSEDPLVVTVEERVAAGHDEPIGHVVIPVARNDLSKSVRPKWYSLWRGMTVHEVAGKIRLRLTMETAYHVLNEMTDYSSDLLPAAP
uniref:Protein kinase domain-containing protein n=4 Tax=Aegilops tauschii subsp. strangulata TaxID=200361 RepID=A0A453DLH9_AEGTS